MPLPGAADGDGAGPAEGGREGPVHERVHRDAAHGAVRLGPEHEFPGDRADPAGGGDLPGDAGGDVAQAGRLLAPLSGAIAERNRDSWLIHADETTWRVFAPGDGGGPAKFWLWVFIGADTVCFVMDPSRAGTVLARHAGIDEDTGQLLPRCGRRAAAAGDLLRFLAVYQSAGRKADGLVNLFCWSHLRRYFVRAGDANPAQLRRWSDAWLARIRDLYAAHDELMAAWQEAAAPPAGGNRHPPGGWRRRTRPGTPRSP